MIVLRRLRGVLATAVLWGLTWLLPGVILGIYRAVTLQIDIAMTAALWLRVLGTFAILWTLWGAVSGAGFAVTLALTERDRSFSDLSFPRFATLGAIGAVTRSAIFLAVVWLQMPFADVLLPVTFVLSLSAVLGAACAMGTLALARRLPRSPHERGGLTSA